MEDNFRNALIILSGVVIAAIFIHGLWTIRKQKNPYKLKASKEKVKPIARDFDGKGFDQDGVSQVKVVKQSNKQKESSEQSFEQSSFLDENSHFEDGRNDEMQREPSSPEQVHEHELELVTSAPQEKPVYQQPVTQAKPVTQKVANKKAETKANSKHEETKRPQIEINFGDGLDLDNESMPNINIDESEEKAKPITKNKKIDKPALETQIVILSVVMPAHQQMSGAALLPSLLTLGMKYGEMNIFHRHQDNAGNGAVTFSLANMLNPGSFELDTMETFATQGVSLFMTLPNATDPFAAFEQMLGAAKQLAAEFNAQIVDDKRNVMTKQTEQHYVGKIREFDRQYRLASVE
jgi:cell division protein ZipA